MSKIKLTIEYLGTEYCGWQSQINGASVQDAVEKALGRYFNCPFVRVYAAGRTDVGVHARGQVAHFTTEKPVNLFKLCLGVNLYLPSDIAVTMAEAASDNFDARFSAVSKDYCYRVYVSPTRKPLLDETHLQVYKPLDVEKMREAAQLLVGTHDFSAFQKKGSNLKGTVRTINSFKIVEKPDILSKNGDFVLKNPAEYADVETTFHEEKPTDFSENIQGENHKNNCVESDDILSEKSSLVEKENSAEAAFRQPVFSQNNENIFKIVEFWVNGNAFLYNQVRNMCGLLLEVGRGKFCLDDVERMLNGEKLRFKTLPPRGLTLEKVYYGNID